MSCSRIFMKVIGRRTELIEWYKRRGFKEGEGREAFPYGDLRFGNPKVKDLYFITLEKEL